MSSRNLKIILIILAIAIGFFHYKFKKRPSAKEIEKTAERISKHEKWQGKFAPDFEIEFLNGEKFELSENIGKKIVILNFFTTWCGPCRREMPELGRYYGNHEGGHFVLIGVNVNEDEEVVRPFIKEEKLNFPVGIDRGREIAEKYGVESYPTTVFIGADGKIALYEVGMISNADITFDSLYKLHKALLEIGDGISKKEYLRKVTRQERVESRLKEKKEGIKLEGRAKELAEKIACPNCGRKLSRCNRRGSRKLRKKLKKMKLENKTDGEILKELFLIKGENK